MFSGRMEVLTDADGWILIDRNGKHFGAILNYLRDGTIPLPRLRLLRGLPDRMLCHQVPSFKA